ncbi:antioxidant, AhpC/TSA family [Sphingobacterium spiritivorum ATCC 33300]|uniref:thioredoxin-dependent peroxiredoxin n=1 Tax=Sphingobacterium spiritivorum ATCC 33300 TaxID=525372 RepID=C2G4B7_SPHSI|nr:peroxiredoxin-like family protein [Sphingobacterium spiritivorum]EEI90035.1 antioxidant, AhpC/TSA family [Sphingobacterium spiritivorum ATCC 33300]QQS94946.1 AhpC/TSA family protein [Sphingobacterium spiritivorum]
MSNLTEQTAALRAQINTQLPASTVQAFEASVQDLKQRNIEAGVIRTGEKLPDFELPNVANNIISSKQLLSQGKLIIAFFRGIWCPYCNLQIRALNNQLNQVSDKKATLVAISPQSLSCNSNMATQHKLDFDVLTDKDNNYARKLGITFELQDFVKPYYKELGIDLAAFNANDTYELPIPAVFVVDTDHTVLYTFADTDYTNRIDPDLLIAQL